MLHEPMETIDFVCFWPHELLQKGVPEVPFTL